jgi:phage protein D
MPPANLSRIHDVDIRINGAPLSGAVKADVQRVTVVEDVGAAGMFSLRLYIWDDEQLRVKWVDDKLFAEGNQVQIQMGYLGSLETLMVGEITGLEPEFSADEPFMMTVRGYDRRHRLLRGRKTRSFVQMKDSDIARQIAGNAGLRPRVQDSKVKLDYVLQHNQTDLEFLQERARRIGYEVLVEDKTLHFRPPQEAQKAALTLSLDQDIIRFYPRSTTLTQVGQIEVRGWNPKGKKPILGRAGPGAERSKMGGRTSGPQAASRAFGKTSSASARWPVFSPAEADQMATGRFNDMALAYVGGEGLCYGRADLRAGHVVEIEGLGQRFSGLYYVTSATHTISATAGYRTAFSVRRNAT